MNKWGAVTVAFPTQLSSPAKTTQLIDEITKAVTAVVKLNSTIDSSHTGNCNVVVVDHNKDLSNKKSDYAPELKKVNKYTTELVSKIVSNHLPSVVVIDIFDEPEDKKDSVYLPGQPAPPSYTPSAPPMPQPGSPPVHAPLYPHMMISSPPPTPPTMMPPTMMTSQPPMIMLPAHSPATTTHVTVNNNHPPFVLAGPPAPVPEQKLKRYRQV